MIERHLRARGIRSQQVLDALATIPREKFVQAEDASFAYDDEALPIDCGQTISQPYIVAAMSEALDLHGNERVLEIGTGSGYQTAVLSRLARDVYSIERHAPLAAAAQARLAELGIRNVHLSIGDGALGLPEFAPFDRIIITAAGPSLPAALWQQLREGGLIVGPFGSADQQVLQLIHKRPDGPHVIDLMPCRFVPLVLGDQPPPTHHSG